MNETYKKILEESLIPLDETLDYIVNSVLNSIKNKNIISDNVIPKKEIIKYVVHKNPVDAVREKYNKWKESSLAVNRFHILDSFEYKQGIINPDKSITKLINSIDEVYLLLRDRASKTTIAKLYSIPIFHSKIEYDYWNKEFNTGLNTLVDSAEEVGLWVRHISNVEYDSKFSNLIKKYTLNKLASFGITDPNSAPKDFMTAAIYIKEYLKRLANEKPKLY